MNTITATKAKNVFAELIDSARQEPVTITRNNRRVAVVLSPDEYDHLTKINDKYWGEKALTAESDGFIGEKESENFLSSILNVKN